MTAKTNVPRRVAALVAVSILLIVFGLIFLRRGNGPPKTTTHPVAATSPGTTEMQMLEQHLANKPDHVPMLLRLAQLSREAGKTADAVKYLRRVVELEPANADARLELGRALFESGDSEGALRETKALATAQPPNADALYNLGAIYGNLGNFEEARRYWRLAVSANPESDSARRANDALRKISRQAPAAP